MSQDKSSAVGAWTMIAGLSLLYFFSYADRMILSLLIVPLQRDLGISDVEFGALVGTSFAVGFAVFGVLLSPLADRVNRKWLIVAGASVWTVSTALMGYARSYTDLLILRLCLAVGEAVLSPAAISIIGDLFAEGKRARPTSIFSAAPSLGSSAAYLGGGVLLSIFAAGTYALPFSGSAEPWRLVMFTIGVAGTASVLLFALLVREPARQHIVNSADTSTTASSDIGGLEAIGYMLAFSMPAFVAFGLNAWAPTFFVRQHGFDVATAGKLFGLITVTTLPLGALLMPTCLAAYRRLRPSDSIASFAGWVLLAMIPFTLLACLVPSALLAWIFLAPTMFIFAVFTAVPYLAIQQIIAPQRRGRAVAIYIFVYTVFAFGMGPLAVAYLSESVLPEGAGLGVATAIPAAILLPLSCLLFVRLNRIRRDAHGRLVGA